MSFLLLSLIFVQHFVSTNATTVHHEKETSTYYCSRACNGVARGFLSSCGGGKHRLESSTIKDWNLSPHILVKQVIIQGQTERLL